VTGELSQFKRMGGVSVGGAPVAFHCHHGPVVVFTLDQLNKRTGHRAHTENIKSLLISKYNVYVYIILHTIK